MIYIRINHIINFISLGQLNEKTIIITLFLLTGIITKTEAQTQLNFFNGTWHYQNGSELFIVSFWTDAEENLTYGHYKMVTVDSNGNETGVIYNSKEPIGTSDTDWPYAIYMGELDDASAEGGPIIDNTVNTPRGFIEGHFIMEINNINSSPLTANWKVKKDLGVHGLNEPEFNIPTDIILTKVSNTIDLD